MRVSIIFTKYPNKLTILLPINYVNSTDFSTFIYFLQRLDRKIHLRHYNFIYIYHTFSYKWKKLSFLGYKEIE